MKFAWKYLYSMVRKHLSGRTHGAGYYRQCWQCNPQLAYAVAYALSRRNAVPVRKGRHTEPQQEELSL